MTKKILVAVQDTEETRVAVVCDGELVDYDSEICDKKPIKGNIYLAKVVRIEPSLQSVFIEYGGNKNGFLPFAEIHEDYYNIPAEDLDKPDEEQILEETASAELAERDQTDLFLYPEIELSEHNQSQKNQIKTKKIKKRYRYNVQEVIRNKQVLLVQAIKDARGEKCAMFTTYLSLSGQYCVLMPKAGDRNGGISKRIHQNDDRIRLKDTLNQLDVPKQMSVIIRTAGQERSQTEIRKDYEYLQRLWNEIKDKTIESNAPMLIHEEADVLMRVVRDFYKKDVDEILIDTPYAHKQIRAFMKKLSPNGVKKVKLFKDTGVSLFNTFDLEPQIVAMVNSRVPLVSGGSLVIEQTEALVSIDVNSGKSIKERNVSAMALKINLEAAKEVAKQLRLRDLSGLIVIDFIDMCEDAHINQVEKCFIKEIEADRARIQVSHISQFCLMEISRQRLRSSVMERYREKCPYCRGKGATYSIQYFASTILRLLEKHSVNTSAVNVSVPVGICNFLLNKKRKEILEIEQKNSCIITIQDDSNLQAESFIIDNCDGSPVLFSLGSSMDCVQGIQQEDNQCNKNLTTTINCVGEDNKKLPQNNFPQEGNNSDSVKKMVNFSYRRRNNSQYDQNRKNNSYYNSRNQCNQNELNGMTLNDQTNDTSNKKPQLINTMYKKKSVRKYKSWLRRIFD
ncbi:MAG: ribonuclease E/G [Holosporales bacterium]|jgi:ribonuclease E|nr:ribonuclease E/G [Holosporales bacterium]